eukprot:664758-Prorocentrum_lima.AAC.1
MLRPTGCPGELGQGLKGLASPPSSTITRSCTVAKATAECNKTWSTTAGDPHQTLSLIHISEPTRLDVI